MTSTTSHRIPTRSTARFLVAGVGDGDVYLIGYAHSAAAAEKRVASARRSGRTAAFAPIVDGAAAFDIVAEEKPGKVLDHATGVVSDGLVTVRRLVAAKAAR